MHLILGYEEEEKLSKTTSSRRKEHNANGKYFTGVKVNKVKVLAKRLDTAIKMSNRQTKVILRGGFVLQS